MMKYSTLKPRNIMIQNGISKFKRKTFIFCLSDYKMFINKMLFNKKDKYRCVAYHECTLYHLHI